MPSPIIKVRDIAFPRYQAPDLDEMETFLHTFGMMTSERTADALYMRGTGSNHHVHVTHRGPAGFLGFGFFATTSDLEVLAQAFGTAVEKSTEPGGGDVVHLTDPDGRTIDVFANMNKVAPLPLRAHAPLNVGADRPRVDVLQRVTPGPSQVRRFGHSAIKTTSLATLASWYANTLGLITSDDMYFESPESPMGRFMRCNVGDSPADHHSLLILETGEVRLGHCAWEVEDFDDLMGGREPLFASGARHYWGVGRHILGGQVFDYWKDPLGFTIEHFTDTDLLTADVAPATSSVFDGINQWGPNPPDDLDF